MGRNLAICIIPLMHKEGCIFQKQICAYYSFVVVVVLSNKSNFSSPVLVLRNTSFFSFVFDTRFGMKRYFFPVLLGSKYMLNVMFLSDGLEEEGRET